MARTREEVLAAAGSRYTYSANTMAYEEAVAGGAEKIALVGMSCQSSVPPVMTVRKAGKPARRFVLNIGLLCSKTFDDAIFEELLEAKHGLQAGQDMVKMNIKGVLQIWMRDGSYHEVPLKECHAWTREGCKMCPDFAAEHADISTGGIGAFGDWTLTIVRTDLGRDLIMRMLEDGTIEGRPGRRRPGRHRAAAQAVAQPAQAVAGGGGRRPPPAPARPAQEEEGAPAATSRPRKDQADGAAPGSPPHDPHLDFAVTWDYRCPFARNFSEHVLVALQKEPGWTVRWIPFSLNQTKVEEGGLDVWDDPEMAPARLAVEVGRGGAGRVPRRLPPGPLRPVRGPPRRRPRHPGGGRPAQGAGRQRRRPRRGVRPGGGRRAPGDVPPGAPGGGRRARRCSGCRR